MKTRPYYVNCGIHGRWTVWATPYGTRLNGDPLLTDTDMGKHYLPHPSECGGEQMWGNFTLIWLSFFISTNLFSKVSSEVLDEEPEKRSIIWKKILYHYVAGFSAWFYEYMWLFEICLPAPICAAQTTSNSNLAWKPIYKIIIVNM